MIGITFELCWYDYVLGRSIHGNFEQQRKTHFQCGNAYFDYGYAHIVAISMLYAVWNICFPCGVTLFYMSQINNWAFHQTFFFVNYIFDFLIQKRSRHDNNYEWIILVYMQHSHPHINLYQEVIFFSWVVMIFYKVESLMMILLCLSFSYFSQPYHGGPIILL